MSVILRVGIALAALAAVVAALVLAGVMIPISADGTASMAPSLPACDGRWLAESVSYWFRDPQRGDIVVFRVDGFPEGRDVQPTPDGDRTSTKRIVGQPGDTVEGRDGLLFVNGREYDRVRTKPFSRVKLEADQYFVVGDNRSNSVDSRDFGPVPRDAIRGRVLLVFAPADEFGGPNDRTSGGPPGDVC